MKTRSATSWAPPPASAAWRHIVARTGFEVAFFQPRGSGWLLEGTTVAEEDRVTWVVDYRIEVDATWTTRRARVASRSEGGLVQIDVEADGFGSWWVDGHPAPHVLGCLDLDLESSAMTNALPVHRLTLAPGRETDAPAAYVRVFGLAVERLEQTYRRLPDDGETRRFAYRSPAFGTACDLVYDASGVVLDYPGIAERVH